MSETYPEHEKLHAVKSECQRVGEFIEWLEEHGYYICEKRNADDESLCKKYVHVPARTAEDIGEAFARVIEMISDRACAYWPTSKRLPETLLSEFFEIDQDKLEAEKRAMLDEMRSRHSTAVASS